VFEIRTCISKVCPFFEERPFFAPVFRCQKTFNHLNNHVKGETDETIGNYPLRSHIGGHYRLLQALYRYNEGKLKIQID
jgi:hypothetical protein